MSPDLTITVKLGQNTTEVNGKGKTAARRDQSKNAHLHLPFFV